MSSFNKEVVKMSDYFTKLVKKVNKVKEIDANLAYEVAYADVYLDNLLRGKECTDKCLKKEYREFKGILDNVLLTIPDKELEDFYSGADYMDLVCSRDEDIETGKVREVTNYSQYMSVILPDVIKLGMVMLLLLYSNTLFSKASVLATLCDVIFSIYIIAKCIRCMIDTLYFTVPMFRLQVGDNRTKIVSNKMYTKCLDNPVVVVPEKEPNRIKRNIYWLNKMLEDKELEQNNYILYDQCKEIKKKLGKDTSFKDKKTYLFVAEIEFLYEQYKKTIQD